MNVMIVISFFAIIISTNADINLQNIEIPDIDDVEVVKERCESKGGKGTYEKVKEAKTNLQNCLQGFIDFDVVKNEIEEAKKTGSMDEVFGKYCAKRPTVKQCITSFTDAITPCLEESEKEALNLTLSILNKLAEFVCYRDGDRIAMFIAEGGVECIKERFDGVKNCVNNTLKINVQLSQNTLPSLLIDKKKCDDFGKLQTCVVEELEKCKDSTPANIVDALLKFIKKSACGTVKTKRSVVVHKIMKRSTDLFQDQHTKMMKAVEDRCKANAGSQVFDNFQAAASQSKQCIKDGSRRVRMFVSSFDEVKELLYDCTNDMVRIGKSCLKPEEQYFPELYRECVFEVLRAIHNNYQKSMTIDYNGKMASLQCVKNLQKAKSQNQLLEDPLNYDQTITKEVFCNALVTSKSQINKMLETHCRLTPEIKSLIDILLDGMLVPCQKKGTN